MKILAPIRLRMEENVVTRVYRRLNGTFSINVQAGQEVMPSDIIGSSQTESGFRILNLATLLSVSPRDVKKYLKRTLGQKIYKGELLASKDGWMLSSKKIVTAPTDAILDFYNEQTGEMRLSFLPTKTNLPSGVYGIVEQVDSLRGFVVIKTLVDRIYGIFGSGKHRDGILRILGNREDITTEVSVRAQAGREQVFVGGSLLYKEAISAAISSGINGIISGGINAMEYKNITSGRLSFPNKIENDIGISIVICEGFGSIPIGLDIYTLLEAYDGRFVFIDGNKAIISLASFESKSMLKIRSTALPIGQEDNFAGGYIQIGELNVGSHVRIAGNYFTGEQGKIIAIDQSFSLLPSGLKAIMATIETSFKKIKIPVNNLEMIR